MADQDVSNPQCVYDRRNIRFNDSENAGVWQCSDPAHDKINYIVFVSERCIPSAEYRVPYSVSRVPYTDLRVPD